MLSLSATGDIIRLFINNFGTFLAAKGNVDVLQRNNNIDVGSWVDLSPEDDNRQ